MNALHVIFGAGPVSCHTAQALIAQGARVRAVNRSGARPPLMPNAVQMTAADLSDPAQALEAATGAAALYQALNPPYHRWHELFETLQDNALTAAQAHGVRYVSIENLYMHDPADSPMHEDSPLHPRSHKGELRRDMAEKVLAAHRRGAARCEPPACGRRIITGRA